ncbi:MAG: hypothetical protein S4CHLAM45_12120 [Chlamydiales bacterium]|nr:hypothetical protein [Chlamydiales bacterium]MCH9619701.1 hypothetical protein [Chlamydiales bacterium]MCH9623307.1 hypothetical protein [Chlamydiales bacterium]
MQTLARLFGRSPFIPLQAHMEKVADCVRECVPLFDALKNKDYERILQLSEKISKLEHDADLVKNDIRNNLPTGLFLPVARGTLLEILTLQDSLADRVEDLGILLTLRPLEILPSFASEFDLFLKKNLEAFEEVLRINSEMGALLESSFGGSEATKVEEIVEKVAFLEHESDLLQRLLLKKIFSECDDLPPQSFFLWMKVIQEFASLSDESEKLANRVRMILEVK